MKSIFLFFIVAAILPFSNSCTNPQRQDNVREINEPDLSEQSTHGSDAHSSQNSLDWPGVYKGALPCADCEGIEIRIVLGKDNTFSRTQTYLGKEEGTFSDKGTFTWNGEGSIISLTAEEGSLQMYQVGENVLFHLDKEGNRITGDLADMYVLKKNRADARLEGKKWILTELMGQKVEQRADMKQAFLTFEAATGRFSGNGSCNTIFGPYELLEGDRIMFGQAASTMMACPDMETERQFMEVLSKADNYSLGEGRMTLNKARMAPLAVFELLVEE